MSNGASTWTWADWFSRHRYSLRTRLIVWNIVLLTTLLGILGVILRVTVQSLMRQAIDKELLMRTQRIVGRRPPPPGADGGFMMPPMSIMEGPPHHEGWSIFGPPGPPRDRPDGPRDSGNRLPPRFLNTRGIAQNLQGRSVGPWDQEAFEEALTGHDVFSNITVDGEPVRLISRPFPQDETPIGVLQEPYSLTEVNRAVMMLNRALLALLPVALLCAGFGGALLTDRALRPVREITRTAGRIGAKDLSERLTVEGKDEFSQLAFTFNGMLERLDTAFRGQRRLIEQQRRFTADASHELRTPLTIIKANTSLCLGSETSVEEYMQSFEDIDRAAEAMSRLVQDLLLLSRSDEGRLGENRISLSVSEALERAAAGLDHREHAPVEMDLPNEPLCISGNEDEIVRLFSNLLENAARYTPATGRITLKARRSDGKVAVSIADTGPGIAAEHLPHLGERFYRVDASRARPDGGSGLGLSICKSIVEAHGGGMAFQSAVGVGTIVTVTLPEAARSETAKKSA